MVEDELVKRGVELIIGWFRNGDRIARRNLQLPKCSPWRGIV